MPNRSANSATLAIALASLLAAIAVPSTSRADDDYSRLNFHNGRVEPASLTLPANTPVKLQVTNLGDAVIEFESFELNRERVVQPGQTITVNLPPLSPGSYAFVDDFSNGAVKGQIVSR
ncbi:MAG: cupredoxin domain-containing protein [Candidatus Binatus sp.]|uniref:cupredoxin domain-containing protein n=1 Tax=Candidatus Binatus sp. TaxID=2811406 RepID=UPI00271DF834|nr:cupredoxin domain-containing protein [Candidatus Binatus sp.]MDO8431847.1 cupredoxin domain-containing protein [Candidatus Binatus sp.]